MNNDYLNYINNNDYPDINNKIWITELPNSNYLIHYLAEQNNDFLLEVIKKYPMLILKRNTDGKFINHILAAREYYTLLIMYLKEAINSIDLLDVRNNHILHYVVINDSVLKELFSLFPKISINITNRNATSPLLNSIIYENLSSFKLLLKNKAKLHLPNNKETVSTCIIKTFDGKLDKCQPWFEVAMKYGENINNDNGLAEIPLQLVYSVEQFDTFDFLVKNGADINNGGTRKQYLIFDMIMNKKWELINKFSKLINFNIKNLSMNSILHEYLSEYDEVNEIITIMELMDDLNDSNINGETVFHIMSPDIILQLKSVLSKKYINLWIKNLNNVAVIDLWKKSKKFIDLIEIWKKGVIHNKEKYPKLFNLVKHNKNVLDIRLTNQNDFRFINVSNIKNNIYSAFIDNLIIYVFIVIKKHKKKMFIPLKKKELNVKITNFDSSEARIIKYRIITKEALTSKLDCFIEYHNPDTYFCPKLPHSFPKKKLTFYVLSLINSNMNHTNIIIIDGFNNIIERFDPEGYNINDEVLDNWVMKKFNKYNSFKYYTNNKNYNANLFQLIELALQDERPGDPVGFCSAWSLWYLEMRIMNPLIHPNELYLKTLNEISKLKISIREYIRNYANSLVKERNPLISKIIGKHSINKDFFSDEDNYKIKSYIDKQFNSKRI